MKSKMVALSAFVLVLAACGRPEPETQPAYIQPIYDKIGNATCRGGYRLAATQTGETVCVPI